MSASRIPLLGRTVVTLELGITPSDLTSSLSRPYLRGTPWQSRTQGSALSLPRATVQSLVGGTKTPQAMQPKEKQKRPHQIQSGSVKMGIGTTLRCEFCGRDASQLIREMQRDTDRGHHRTWGTRAIIGTTGSMRGPRPPGGQLNALPRRCWGAKVYLLPEGRTSPRHGRWLTAGRNSGRC